MRARLRRLVDGDDDAKPDIRAHHIALGVKSEHPSSSSGDSIFAVLLGEGPRSLLDIVSWIVMPPS
jgi:hypothetical protein